MLCSGCGLKIDISPDIEGYQATATANGHFIAMVTMICEEIVLGPENITFQNNWPNRYTVIILLCSMQH